MALYATQQLVWALLQQEFPQLHLQFQFSLRLLSLLLLLGLVVYFSRRQLARRLEAELESRKAQARAQTVLNRVAGLVFLALALRLATSER